MAREIKDELLNQPEMPDQPEKETNTVQLQLSEDMEKQLVQIIMEDWNASKTARNNKEYGIDSKGASNDFDKWLKSLRDLYNARREAKEIPWKYCSNRGLRISTSILDMIHARLLPAVISEDLVRWKPGESTDSKDRTY